MAQEKKQYDAYDQGTALAAWPEWSPRTKSSSPPANPETGFHYAKRYMGDDAPTTVFRTESQYPAIAKKLAKPNEGITTAFFVGFGVSAFIMAVIAICLSIP